MKNRRNPKTILCALTLACGASGTAMAYEPMSFDPYIGGNYGAVDVNDSNFNDNNDAYQIRLGANVLPFLGFEIGYSDFGSYGGELSNIDANGYSLAAVGRLPVTEAFGLYAKAGQLWWDAKYNVAGFNGDTNDSDLFFGVGAELEIAENLDLVVAYDRYKIDVSNAVTDLAGQGDYKADLNFASVGVNFSF